jgi:hypothetical protein
MFVRGNELQAGVAFGFNVLEFDAQDRWQRGPVFVGIRQHSSHRDRPFYGIGPDSDGKRTWYAITRWEGWVFGGVDAGPHVRLQLSEGFRRESPRHSTVDPSIETRFDPKTLPGFEELNLALLSGDLKLDSRRYPEENTGVRLLGNATYAQDVEVADRSFVTTEVDAEAALEVSKPDRVLTARFYGADSFRIGREPVPLTHLAMLGWQNHLGFVWGRFRDESALMAEVRYRYPIAYFMDAQFSVSAGNVFAHDFKDFEMGKLTTSFAFGLRTRRTGLMPLQLMVGFGTTRFEQPFNVESVRVYLGTTEGL